MYVNLLDFTSGKRQVMATIRVQEGRLLIEGSVPPTIRGEIEATRQCTGTDDLFLKALPTVFSGTYIRAELKE